VTPHTFTDVACTVCGSVCDDLRVSVAGGRVLSADRACRLARPWFDALNGPPQPAAEIADSRVSLAEAYARAADLLNASKYPLIYGLSRSTTEGQRAAVALADKLGGTIDTTASTGHAPSIMALQQVGESTCTLGEVKQRADVVVFWGSDPLVTHPRHIERYCPPRPGRTTVVVDTRETETAKAADLFVPVTAGCQWEAVWELRTRVADSLRESVPMSPSERATHPSRLAHLASLLRSAKFGVIFFGGSITAEPLAHRTVEALLQLVTDLNRHTRFYARRMRRYGDVAGADSVLAWQTGYPFGVNLSAGYPRYNPGEFTGPDMLARGEPDLCVLVGSETAADFPPDATEHLRTIPVIALDPPHVRPPFTPAVRFTTAVYGVHRPGTAYRMDEVAIPLRMLTESNYPSDGEVLTELLRRVG
jgi:formylmethanofuran dehydrogenase subunit B